MSNLSPESELSQLSTDELRQLLIDRLSMSINAWAEARKVVSEYLFVGQRFEEVSRVNRELARCDAEVRQNTKLLVDITHLDKLPPLERLDDAEIREQLLSHVTASLHSFSVEELDVWINRLAEARQRNSHATPGVVLMDDLADLGIS